MSSFSRNLIPLLWDAWCVISVAGIWPRFIEPQLLRVTTLPLSIPSLHPDLEGLRIVQISDLHHNDKTSERFLMKLQIRIMKLRPDIILFTGDFLCFSQCVNMPLLKHFLCSLSAPHGCYAVFGNHDYEKWVSVNDAGDYDCAHNNQHAIVKGFKLLFGKKRLTGHTTERALNLGYNTTLLSLLNGTSITVLKNETAVIPIKDSFLNVCGLGEYTLGKCKPESAFQNYNSEYPGIVCAHNPDSFPILSSFPGDIILAGHTHAGQVNLPFFKGKFISLENPEFSKGLIKRGGKKMYVNRGIGSPMTFRWCALPEILLITLEKDGT